MIVVQLFKEASIVAVIQETEAFVELRLLARADEHHIIVTHCNQSDHIESITRESAEQMDLESFHGTIATSAGDQRCNPCQQAPSSCHQKS